jgi:hypothetical protein
MRHTPLLVGSLLAGIALLLYTSIMPPVVAEAHFSGSIEKVKAFHDNFKDPSFMGTKGETLLSPELLAKAASFPRDSAWPLGGLIAIDSNKTRELAYKGLVEPPSHSFNSLSIDVSRITVIAINMGKGGNAVATSDIVLNPIQYLGVSSDTEVEEKLK